ncbi:restriction endonuclease [Tenuibacillus multivorans]|uniref:Restriction system protein n=1 Tax=Tenuibacillus multivorans TaxID=237069 RepID=A0A1H0AUB5_9BACI|nr:restriction endonuclease [Tenuibacillus multivorans]GEL77816.1 hypothetical protein TMU01_20510 [Tenuibacillus multivorans]SDN37001.1 restriction system protein [Tenuibacillus multivorans]
MIFLVILQLILIGVLMWFLRKEQREKEGLVARKIERGEDLKKTMAMGLTYRFNFPRHKNEDDEIEFENASTLFIKQTPFEFEDFVGNIIKKKFNGHVYTSAKSHDYGVDFEHHIDGDIYLGQVKVYKHDVGFEPVALIHSNMIKNEAKGGYVITTGSFTDAAQKYAQDLNIQLIDGITLVDYWLEGMESTVYEPSGEFA